ncbi:Kinase, NAK [Giardia muris]|uniref:non-specific serine/threonine protein kinase n=1 Tax=Giardia muris TaxID=5742 RepID=A0A4Z1TDG7_GIAMU|nr:Kinase, NAK [Giardia muris]|eukprot:TNJ30581.1 Kinase, NAK [Giardia muris]
MNKAGKQSSVQVEKRPKNCPNDGFLGSTLSIGGRSLIVRKYITQGGFGFVYVAANPSNPEEEYAVKRMIIQTGPQYHECLDEAYYHVLFSSHPAVVKLYAITLAGRNVPLDPDTILQARQQQFSRSIEIHFLLELCRGGSLVDLMVKQPTARFAEEFIWVAFSRIVSAVCTMHAHGITNRDLKIENILVTSPFQEGRGLQSFHANEASYIKLCDFGSCTSQQYLDGAIFSRDMVLRTQVENEVQRKTTPSYRAPEMIDFFTKFPITVKSDVFALGVLLFRLMYFTLPFPDGEILANFNCRYTIPPTPNYSQELKNIIGMCLVKDPAQRADIWQVAEYMNTRYNFQYTPRPQNITPPNSMSIASSTSQDQALASDMGMPVSSTPLMSDDSLFGFGSLAAPSVVAPTQIPAPPSFGMNIKPSTLAAAQGFQMATTPKPQLASSGQFPSTPPAISSVQKQNGLYMKNFGMGAMATAAQAQPHPTIPPATPTSPTTTGHTFDPAVFQAMPLEQQAELIRQMELQQQMVDAQLQLAMQLQSSGAS